MVFEARVEQSAMIKNKKRKRAGKTIRDDKKKRKRVGKINFDKKKNGSKPSRGVRDM